MSIMLLLIKKEQFPLLAVFIPAIDGGIMFELVCSFPVIIISHKALR